MADWKRPGTNLVYSSAYKKPKISWDEHEKRDREEFAERLAFAKRPRRMEPMGPIEQWQARDPWRQRLKPGRFDVELKWLDQNKTFATVSATGAIEDSINHIVQSDGQTERIGRKAVIHSISWRYTLTLPTEKNDDPVDGDIVRIILFLDKQCNKATAGVTDILETQAHMSFNNLAQKDRFHIVYDQVHELIYTAMARSGGTTSVDQSSVTKYFSTYNSVNTPIEFSGSTGAITEITSNNYGFLIISKNGLAGMESFIRIRFTS